MKSYDVVFLHPPRAFESFSLRLKRIALKKLGFKREEIKPQYCQMPMGIISLAANLDEKGYEAKIFNLGLEQKVNPFFDLKRYIKSINAKIFAIDLQWFVHSAGALKVAKVCKMEHPNSLIVLGGMTATWFHTQIMKNYPFVDIIIRGEADLSMLHLVESYIRSQKIDAVKGITYRQNGKIKQTPLGEVLSNLNSINPCRLDLINRCNDYLRCDIIDCGEEKTSFFWIPIARGCIYNCAHCGGGQYSYSLLTGREKTALRSPEKVSFDIQVLQEKGIKRIHLSHDPEIGGRKYYLNLFKNIKEIDADISVYVEIFRLPTREFTEEITKTFNDVIMAISPETFSEEVRRIIGRSFSNHAFFRSLDFLRRKNVKTQVWFTIGLPGENFDLKWFENFRGFCEKIVKRGAYIVPPLVYTIDPNCLLSVESEKYGIRLLLRTFKDYKNMCESDKPLDWVGHETQTASREKILAFTMYAYNCAIYFQKLK
jgi:B12-binding domain/radical SAM domain protein